MIAYIILAIVIMLGIVIISAGVKVVPQSETRVVERLGRFHSVLAPGLNFIIPFVDRPKTIYTRKIDVMGGRHFVRTIATSVIDLREQVYDFPSQQVITRDNVTTEINALLYF
ncbi:MAG: SPFH/Band 7/PHB domain protein, partial [Muribaculaceae bacterium]|nr:SPFH/Band 7/PHB domain protein [Muribaculaceae bacterium]